MTLVHVVAVKNSKNVAQLSYFVVYEDILIFSITIRSLNKSLNKEKNNAKSR